MSHRPTLRRITFVLAIAGCAHSPPGDEARAPTVVDRSGPTPAPSVLDSAPLPGDPPPSNGELDVQPSVVEPSTLTPVERANRATCDTLPADVPPDVLVIYNADCLPPATPTPSPLMRQPARPVQLTSDGLRRHYPSLARTQGVPGRAAVRLTVSIDGELTSIAIRHESPQGYGFGAACQAYLRTHETGWQPALDREGLPVTHTFTFHCEFSPYD